MKLAAFSLPAAELVVNKDIVGSDLLCKKNGLALAGTDANAQKLCVRWISGLPDLQLFRRRRYPLPNKIGCSGIS
jgi:hypothetical protein